MQPHQRDNFCHWSVQCAMVVMASAQLIATEFYVAPVTGGTTSSPAGSTTNSGSITSPWALQTALNHPAAVHPGDTIWLRGGTYTGTFSAQLVGTITAPIIVRAKPGERVILDAAMAVAPILSMNGAYTWIWGLEMTCSNPNRVFPTKDSPPRAFGLTDSACIGGKYINNIVYDILGDFNIWNGARDSEVYGNIGFNGGIDAPDRGHYHGIYSQNSIGRKYIEDNIWFGHLGAYGVHVYTEGGYIDNFTVVGNIQFRDNFEIGGLRPASGIVANENLLGEGAGFYIGWSNQANVDAEVVGNYIGNRYGSTVLKYWSGMTFRDNTLVSSVALYPQSAQSYAAFDIDANDYFGYSMRVDGVTNGSFAAWQGMGFDPNGTSAAAVPSRTDVIVRPNRYELGRAHVAVFNWTMVNSVAIDLSGIGLSIGDGYEIRDVQNIFAAAAVTGTYTGATVTVPLNLTTRTPYVGDFTAAYHPPNQTHTSKEFNAFLVLKTSGATTAAPAITTQPQSISVSTGQTATFTVVATGTPPPFYQWQLNEANISGANSASYTTAATALADNNARYRVVVSNAVSSVTSATATLTVTAGGSGSGSGGSGSGGGGCGMGSGLGGLLLIAIGFLVRLSTLRRV